MKKSANIFEIIAAAVVTVFMAILVIFAICGNASAAYVTPEPIAELSYNFDIPAYADETTTEPSFWFQAGQKLVVLGETESRYFVEATAGTAICRMWIDIAPLQTYLGSPITIRKQAETVSFDVDVPAYGNETDTTVLFELPAGQEMLVLDKTETRLFVEVSCGTAITRVWVDRDPMQVRLGTPICLSISETLIYSSTGSDAAVMLIPYGTPYMMLEEVNGMRHVIVPFGEYLIEGYVYTNVD